MTHNTLGSAFNFPGAPGLVVPGLLPVEAPIASPAEATVAPGSASSADPLAAAQTTNAASEEKHAPQTAAKRATSMKLALITPWKQECGNAEYAERLCVALQQFADVQPIDLRNFAEDFELRSKSKVREYFKNLIQSIHATDADMVHIQHEFCFFGRSIQRSNHEFLKFVKAVRKPVVVTLHTWLERSGKHKSALKNFLKRPLEAIRGAMQKKDLYRALQLCDGIVVHTHDTYTLVVSAYPKLRNKVRIVQIPIAPVEQTQEKPLLVKPEGDHWILLPGFVSPYKGHKHAVNALEFLPKNYKLVIAGGRHPKDRGASRYWMDLLALVEERNLQSRVLFTGFLPTGGAQAAVLSQADLFLLPYDEVGQSGSAVLADALAYDRPVVTSRARSMFAYRMSQDTVYCCASTDVTETKDLAALVERSIENGNNEVAMAQHRKAAIHRYSMSATAEAYERLYMDVRNAKL